MSTNKKYQQFLEELQQTPPVPESLFDSINRKKRRNYLPYISAIAAMLILSLIVKGVYQQEEKPLLEDNYFSYMEEYDDFDEYDVLAGL